MPRCSGEYMGPGPWGKLRLIMEMLAGKRVLLGVSGGIAAYKSADLVRRLRERGAEVRVVMTRAAQAFVTPLTFQALSGHRVYTELLDPEAEASMGHIELARWADVVLAAPASADFLARLAHGLADDLLTTLCLASAAPPVVAPSMNRQMWQAPATQANCALLAERGVRLLGPAAGGQACGEEGPGRMLEPAELVDGLGALFAGGALAGVHVLITAGPTQEDLDPVRFISNRSSGRMGYALARAALEAGAQVTLVSGPVALDAPSGARVLQVRSAEEMRTAVLQGVQEADVFIAAAAVADYRPSAAAAEKIKKTGPELALTLTRTADILAEVAGRPHPPFTVGFAAETCDLEHHARQKLLNKGLDMVAANQVGIPGLGFDAEDNALEVLWAGGGCSLPRAPKGRLARELIDLVAERYRASHRTQDPGYAPG